MTADALMDRLRLRCAAPAWAFFPEFRSATGAHVRSIDALGVSLFASRGLEVHGHEVKVARSDLAREIADPEKAEAIAQYCDRFWLVVPDADVIGDLDVPEPWGVLVASGEGLRATRKAQKLPGLPPGRVRGFIASLARRAAEDVVPKRDVQRMIHEKSEEARAADRAFYARQVDWRAARAEERVAELEATLKKFSDAVGQHLTSWNAEKVGGALRTHLEGGDAAARTEAFAERAIRELDAAREALARLLPEGTTR